jgi:hypothetical protein
MSCPARMAERTVPTMLWLTVSPLTVTAGTSPFLPVMAGRLPVMAGRLPVMAGSLHVMAGPDPAIPATAVAAVSHSIPTVLAVGDGRINHVSARLIQRSYHNDERTINPPKTSPTDSLMLMPIGLVPEQIQGRP